MRLVAKGVIEGGYWAFGRCWPRMASIEVIVTKEEGDMILADPNIVAVVVDEPKAKAKAANEKSIEA